MASLVRILAVSAALAALSACATAPPAASSSGAATAAASYGKTSTYGLYLAGQAAILGGDSKTAADYFGRASAANEDAGFLKERVFTAALMAGDVPRAAATAPGPDEGSPNTRALGALTQAVEALALGKGADAYAKLSEGAVAPSAPAALLKPWAAAAAGKTAESLATPATTDRLLKLIAAMDQALLFERVRRYTEAETTYKALLSDKVAQSLVAPAFGVFLERRGRHAEAIAIYDQLLADSPSDRSFQAARARAVAKGRPPAAPTIREGAAQALMAPAAAVLSDRQPELGLIYLRLVLRLDPAREEAWLMAGDVMSAGGDVASARDAYARVSAKSPRYAEARSRLAWSYQEDDKPTALKLARETVAAQPENDTAKLTLADLLRANNQFEESARVLDPVIASAGEKADWRLYYMRAVALERSGRWQDAETDLGRALSMKPDQPEVLNYLGYSWVNRGVKVKEGMAMIQRAVDAQPDEGAYVDSLGWAYYRLGQYKLAVETLERAAQLMAGDPEINDHLGDAYWRVGRRDEAQFQWRAVLTFKPDAEIKARAEAKLASPLGPDVVAKGPTVAQQ